VLFEHFRYEASVLRWNHQDKASRIAVFQKGIDGAHEHGSAGEIHILFWTRRTETLANACGDDEGPKGMFRLHFASFL
jgi:hypothetical protein